MKISDYTILVDDYPKKGESLAYHSRTQALIKIDNVMRKQLNDIHEIEVQKKMGIHNLDALESMGILVKDQFEDKRKFDNFITQLTNDAKKVEFQATILTTYECNFDCVYCFESNVRDKKYLSEPMAEKILLWLKNRIKERGYKKIRIVFYGGEPLLNFNAIKFIVCDMNKWADENNIEFRFNIITNGSLISDYLITELLAYGLDGLQITVDGTREFHNKKRYYKGKAGSFDNIIHNLISVIDKVKIKLVSNFDEENADNIFEFIDYLEYIGILHKFDRIGFAPILPRLGTKEDIHSIELGECLNFFEKGTYMKIIEYKKYLLGKGVDPGRSISLTACPLISEDLSVSIDTEGYIYKCNSFLGYEEYSLGRVVSDEFKSKMSRFINIKGWEQCDNKCSYLPICLGGCRFLSFIENENLTDSCCKWKYLNKLFPELIKLDYQRESKSSLVNAV